MSRTGSLYIEKDSIFHRLDGSIKLVMLICWTSFIFMFMDARVFAVMTAIGFLMLAASKLPAKSIMPLVMFVIIFTIFNSVFLMLITPEYGSKLSGSYTTALRTSGYRLTYETVFYAFTLSLKYISILPITLLFIFTTNPSSFAGSLNRLGVSYRVSYAISIALRYIPDVMDEVNNIINAQEARGVAFKKGDAGLLKRMKNYVTVLIPLLISSLHRVEVVSNAMDLRGFGRNKKRTWYAQKPIDKSDVLFFVTSIILVLTGVFLKHMYLNGFWYI